VQFFVVAPSRPVLNSPGTRNGRNDITVSERQPTPHVLRAGAGNSDSRRTGPQTSGLEHTATGRRVSRVRTSCSSPSTEEPTPIVTSVKTRMRQRGDAAHSTPTFYDVRVITVRLVAPFPAAVTTGIRRTIGQRR
jgi:hypothetical protein